MRTVKELKAELDKFPDNALCWAYEGEAIGIGIRPAVEDFWAGRHGFIYCDNTDEPEPDTRTLE